MSLDLPAGVSWSLADSSESIELDERVVMTVPVRPQLEGRPPPGFVLATTRAEPATVSVNVPRGRAARLKAVETRPIDVGSLGLNAARREVTVEVPLELSGSAARLARGASDTVRVTVGLQQAGPPAAPKVAP